MELLDTVLRHPLILLIAGAVLTGLVAPWITGQWQHRQKRLEIKADLVTELSELVMRITMAVQFIHLGSKSFTQDDFDQAYLEWEVGSAVLGTKLQAYLGGESSVPSEWTRFAEAMTDFYALEGVPAERRDENVSHFLAQLKGKLDNNQPTWRELRDALLGWKGTLINDLINAKVRLSA